MNALLTVSDLTAGYGRKAVLKDVTFEVSTDEFVVMAGPNGAGKSTLLRTLTGLQPALGGNICIDGKELKTLSAARRARLLSLVTTERPAAGHLTVNELVSLGRYPHTGWLGRLDATDRSIVSRAIADVGLEHKATACIADLSDGECQKAMIARALAQQTPVMLLDEPTSFLDIAARHEVSELLARIAAQGTAVIMSTHDIAAALPRATHAIAVAPDGTVTKLAVSSPALESTLTALFASRGLHYDPAAADFRRP